MKFIETILGIIKKYTFKNFSKQSINGNYLSIRAPKIHSGIKDYGDNYRILEKIKLFVIIVGTKINYVCVLIRNTRG
jgi:hypothetical protein